MMIFRRFSSPIVLKKSNSGFIGHGGIITFFL
jgi:hypothetical protein